MTTFVDLCVIVTKLQKLNCELFSLSHLKTKDLTDVKSFNTKNQVITLGTELSDVYNEITGHFDERVSGT